MFLSKTKKLIKVVEVSFSDVKKFIKLPKLKDFFFYTCWGKKYFAKETVKIVGKG